MATDLRRSIEHVVIVMMENRSFDHMLGYLNLPPWNHGRPAVDGLRHDPEWVARYTNYLDSVGYPPHQFTDRVIEDPPHTRPSIAGQLGASLGAAGPMTGFVSSYAQRKNGARDLSHVMGYYAAPEVPMCDFLARNFLVCDRWFAALPAGTQPNRLMAMAGASLIDDNASVYLPDQELVYDWLTERGVTWRVYHDGIVPFMGLMRKWMDTINVEDHKEDLGEAPLFRWLDYLEDDLKNATVPCPQVVFVEPDYTDIPFMHSAPPNDDHPPSSIDFGQRFLRQIYQAFTSRPDIWARTVMIVTYDEHGGFFDHVEPPAIPTSSPSGGYRPFATLGVRVPAFVVSPYVEAGSVFSGPLDHTSILKLLGERFNPGGVYSDDVERRLQGNPRLQRISEALGRETPRGEVPHPREVMASMVMPENVAAFHHAITSIRRRTPDRIVKYLRTDLVQEAP